MVGTRSKNASDNAKNGTVQEEPYMKNACEYLPQCCLKKSDHCNDQSEPYDQLMWNPNDIRFSRLSAFDMQFYLQITRSRNVKEDVALAILMENEFNIQNALTVIASQPATTTTIYLSHNDQMTMKRLEQFYEEFTHRKQPGNSQNPFPPLLHKMSSILETNQKQMITHFYYLKDQYNPKKT